MITNASFLAVGLAAGLLHFVLLRWNTALYLGGSRIWVAPGLQLLRLGLLAGMLAMVSLHGALPLLLAALGLLIARLLVMKRMALVP